tara:strand:+ start:18502 stop:19446 length:945 start_codon:yes stop_codon:yes gene_type:complete
MKILVTGGSGFIGTNLISILLSENHKVLNIDKLSYASNTSHKDSEFYELIKGDLTELNLIKIFEKFNPDGIIHCAAESHVDNSIEQSSPFIYSNILGTYKLIEAVRIFNKDIRFLHMSTDEVYGSLDSDDEPFNELSRYDPSSPYSATKASSDLIIKSWQRTYDMNTIITNCSNNFGKWQHLEKMIPSTIKALKDSQKINVYGNGENVRDWIFVDDHCWYVYKIFLSDFYDQTFNIGGLNEISNNDLVRKILKTFNKIKGSNLTFQDSVKYVEDRQGHDQRYAICMKKTISKFGNNLSNFENCLEDTIRWYLKN